METKFSLSKNLQCMGGGGKGGTEILNGGQMIQITKGEKLQIRGSYYQLYLWKTFWTWAKTSEFKEGGGRVGG